MSHPKPIPDYGQSNTGGCLKSKSKWPSDANSPALRTVDISHRPDPSGRTRAATHQTWQNTGCHQSGQLPWQSTGYLPSSRLLRVESLTSLAGLEHARVRITGRTAAGKEAPQTAILAPVSQPACVCHRTEAEESRHGEGSNTHIANREVCDGVSGGWVRLVGTQAGGERRLWTLAGQPWPAQCP